MKVISANHSELPKDKVICSHCGNKIADLNNEGMTPDFLTCYKRGNIPVPNFGWLCSFECAVQFEVRHDVKFMRTSDERIDYYENEL